MIEIIKNIVKLGPELIRYTWRINSLKKEKVVHVILGTPVHENMGDHLITFAEKEYLKKELGILSVLEVPIEAYKLFKKSLIQNISEEAIIFINGGGWMGNIWPNDELLLEDMVRNFPNNRIIIFPQSMFFDNKKKDYEYIVNHSIETFENIEQCTLCVRDKKSFEMAKQLYPFLNIKLLPDITLYLYGNSLFSDVQKRKNTKTVGICLRADREMSANRDLISKCLLWCKNNDYKIIKVSTVKNIRIPSYVREKALLRLARRYKGCRFVVTDRLHGMILSYLCGVPCIVFDNATGKISSLYNTWLRNCSGIYLTQGNEEDFLENVKKLLSVDNIDKIDNLNFDFSFLKSEISEIGG